MDPQAHGYTVVAFHPESKGIVLNINHDIVPQVIGNALTGVSPSKEISKVNATQHTTTLQEKGIKERNNQTKD